MIPGRDFGDHSTSDRTRPRLYQLRLNRPGVKSGKSRIRAVDYNVKIDIPEEAVGSETRFVDQMPVHVWVNYQCERKWRDMGML